MLTAGHHWRSLPFTASISAQTCPLPVPHPSFPLAQAIFEPNIFLHKYHNNLNPVIQPAYTPYEDETGCSETTVYKIQMQGNHPKERILHHEGVLQE